MSSFYLLESIGHTSRCFIKVFESLWQVQYTHPQGMNFAAGNDTTTQIIRQFQNLHISQIFIMHILDVIVEVNINCAKKTI